MSYQRQSTALQRHLKLIPFADRLKEIAPDAFEEAIWEAVLDHAARFAENALAPARVSMDEEGCRVIDGHVLTGNAQKEAWQAYKDGGWLSMPLPADAGGQELPLTLLSACEEMFNRAAPALMMLPTATRCAAAMLHAIADPAVRDQWVPQLASGEWTSTICISEPDAGSDVGRIRSRATMDAEGIWRITGEKCWISFGDHDLAERIGHCMLARTSATPGTRGLSLFLVPNKLDDLSPNGVFVRRIEEKLGLHGSPTCVLGFEDARAHIIGVEGRGLQQLFQMMLLMRLSCGPQGVGVAAGAAETALAYALDRKQGGNPNEPPIAICDHVDVQRQLLSLFSRVEVARGLSLATAAAMDLGERGESAEERERALALAQWLLPIVKDLGARTGFDVATDAIQVLGGAGYTKEWPIEQALRDARVFAIFEGTTGMQALDLLHRRLWRDGGSGLYLFLDHARADSDDGSEAASRLITALDALEQLGARLLALKGQPREAEAGAFHYLNACSLAAGGWIAVRIARYAGNDTIGKRLASAAHFYLAELHVKMAAEVDLALLGASRIEQFSALTED